MPDSLRVMHDTLVIKQFSDLDVLDKVNTFYTSSWDRLIITVSIAFGIVGIIIPLIIQWYQRKTLQLSEDNLQALIISEIDKAKEELKSEFTKRLEEVIHTYDTKIEDVISETYARTYHLQARINFDSENYVRSFVDIMDACNYYPKTEHNEQIKVILRTIDELILSKVKSEELKSLNDEDKSTIQDTLGTLVKMDDTEIVKIAEDLLKKYNEMIK
ncbi:MAG TPA: hypothetical protein VK167_03125 [Flavipsychrobacter sp.]|nr:hypothetical protein [Flavipsychrobacter sp.]